MSSSTQIPVKAESKDTGLSSQMMIYHSDEQAAMVLKNLKEAMGPGSFVLVDEIVIQNTGADWMGVHMDMVVMAGLAGMERTQAQWEGLLKDVGQKVREMYKYNPETSDAILEVVAEERVPGSRR